MKKPFALFQLKKKKKSRLARTRLEMPMRSQASECEWLVAPSNSSPEQALGIAVLQRAILDTITPGVSDKDRISAVQWLSGELGHDFENNYALSFTRIVESITEIDVDEFRLMILRFVNIAQNSEDSANGFRFQRS